MQWWCHDNDDTDEFKIRFAECWISLSSKTRRKSQFHKANHSTRLQAAPILLISISSSSSSSNHSTRPQAAPILFISMIIITWMVMLLKSGRRQISFAFDWLRWLRWQLDERIVLLKKRWNCNWTKHVYSRTPSETKLLLGLIFWEIIYQAAKCWNEYHCFLKEELQWLIYMRT